MSADNELSHKSRVAQSKGKNKVGKQKCGTAIRSSICGKAPDIAEANCRTRSGHEKAEPG